MDQTDSNRFIEILRVTEDFDPTPSFRIESRRCLGTVGTLKMYRRQDVEMAGRLDRYLNDFEHDVLHGFTWQFTSSYVILRLSLGES